MTAQDVYLNSNTSFGSNCGQNNTEQRTISNLYLQGFKLELRNTDLIVTNRVFGSGEIDFCGNANNPSSTLCVANGIDSNVITNGLVCRTLDVQDFELQKLDTYKEVNIYDVLGIYVGNSLQVLEKNKMYLAKVKGFKSRKIVIQ